MKVVINTDFGGFSVSKAAVLWLRERGHQMALEEPVLEGESYGGNSKPMTAEDAAYHSESNLYSIERTDPLLVECVEALGKASWGQSASLKVVEIPDDVVWYIHEYDGMEHIAERHRTWY